MILHSFVTRHSSHVAEFRSFTDRSISPDVMLKLLFVRRKRLSMNALRTVLMTLGFDSCRGGSILRRLINR